MAVVNIQIPLRLGDVVNIVSHFTEATGTEAFLEQIREPAMKLIGLYGLQVTRLVKTKTDKFHITKPLC